MAYRFAAVRGEYSENWSDGRLSHDVPDGSWRALCGVTPSREIGAWAAFAVNVLTCPKCRAKRDRFRAAEQVAAAGDPRRV